MTIENAGPVNFRIQKNMYIYLCVETGSQQWLISHLHENKNQESKHDEKGK